MSVEYEKQDWYTGKVIEEDGLNHIEEGIANIGDEVNNFEASEGGDYSALQQAIDAEAAARESADSTLQTAIDTEAETRESADNTLQENIDAEAVIREENDTALQGNIDAEAAARESADNTEAAARESADTEINDKIDNLEDTQHVFLTQAEYDALGDEKLTDGKIYFISEGG